MRRPGEPLLENKNIVYVCHGLFFHPWVMKVLSARLRRAGWLPVSLSHDTRTVSVHEAAQILSEHHARVGGPFRAIGHSLGGHVALEAARILGAANNVSDVLVPPRDYIVCLGTPLRGAGLARMLVQTKAGGPWVRRVLGASWETLNDSIVVVPSNAAVLSIAGHAAIGLLSLGVLLPSSHRPALWDTLRTCEHDGTVCVHETNIPGLANHIVVRGCPHAGLVFHAEVARLCLRFLSNENLSA